MRTGIFAALALCLLIPGCDDSTAPLSDPGGATPDENLAGLWCYYGDEGQRTYYHIGHVDGELPQGVMQVVGVTHREGKVSAPETLLLFPTTLDGKAYMNVTDGDQAQVERLQKEGWKAAKGYSLIRYQIDGNRLTLRLMNSDAKKKAIETGQIKGTKVKNRPARFTDTTENLARFVAKAGDSLFSDDAVQLVRVDTEKGK